MSNNSMNIPSLVNNIENNIDTFGNNMNPNYIPIDNSKNQNLQYNPNVIPQINNGSQNQYNPQITQPPPQQMGSQMGSQMEQIQQLQNLQNQLNMLQKNNSVVNSIENMDNSEGFVSSYKNLIIKVSIYTVLFVIFSHTKMTNLVCDYVPLIDSLGSNIPCITFKGLLMAVTIITIHKFIKID